MVAVVEYSFPDRFAVEKVDASLIDEQRHVVVTQVFVGNLQCLQWPTADADIKGLTLTDNFYESLQRLLEWSVGVVSVAVEQVYIVEVHTLEALVDARHEVFA